MKSAKSATIDFGPREIDLSVAFPRKSTRHGGHPAFYVHGSNQGHERMVWGYRSGAQLDWFLELDHRLAQGELSITILKFDSDECICSSLFPGVSSACGPFSMA